jgi:hypothetical protein
MDLQRHHEPLLEAMTTWPKAVAVDRGRRQESQASSPGTGRSSRPPRRRMNLQRHHEPRCSRAMTAWPKAVAIAAGTGKSSRTAPRRRMDLQRHHEPAARGGDDHLADDGCCRSRSAGREAARASSPGTGQEITHRRGAGWICSATTNNPLLEGGDDHLADVTVACRSRPRVREPGQLTGQELTHRRGAGWTCSATTNPLLEGAMTTWPM